MNFFFPLVNKRATTRTFLRRLQTVFNPAANFPDLLKLVMPNEINQPASGVEVLPLSKNQQKKLKRDQEWEAGREARKAKRKEKVKEKKLQKRAAREEATYVVPQGPKNSPHVYKNLQSIGTGSGTPKPRPSVQLPVTFIIDCGFDNLMNDKERKSLGSQITRSYSDNHKAPYQAYLAISSFGGHLKERFESVLSGNYRSWKSVQFLEADFVQAAERAKSWMLGEQGGKMAGVFEKYDPLEPINQDSAVKGEIVYLSSDSPSVLTELRPYSTYIIGGLVDRNRHKGVCYKAAMGKGIKTAKLPIGDYMQMTSRFVLATNHVAEIMLRWLEVGDWGQAFLQVIPKRKGGTLKDPPHAGELNELIVGSDENGVQLAEKSPHSEGTHLDEVGQANEADDIDDDTRSGVPLSLDSTTLDENGLVVQSSQVEEDELTIQSEFIQ